MRRDILQDIIHFETVLYIVLAFAVLLAMMLEKSYFEAIGDIALFITLMFFANYISDIKTED